MKAAMLFDWSAACSPDDPLLVIPWDDPDSGLHFVDLRADPDALDDIPEAEQHPALLASLRALNGTRSAVFTAKCDVWPADQDELAALEAELALEPALAAAGQVSYIDVVSRDRALFTSFHQQQHLLNRLERRLAPLDHPLALAEAVVRPAFLDLGQPQEGFALSLYVKAAGPDAQAAVGHWAAALASLTATLRKPDLFPQT